MPPSAFPSPAVTAASRCCSASVRHRAAFDLTRSLSPALRRQRTWLPSPSSASSFELLQLLVFLLPRGKPCQSDSAKMPSLIQQKSDQIHPWRRPRRGLGNGLGAGLAQLSTRPVAPCRWVPAPAHPPEGRLRRAHQGKERAENLCKAMHGLQMCVRKISGSIDFSGLTCSSLL